MFTKTCYVPVNNDGYQDIFAYLHFESDNALADAYQFATSQNIFFKRKQLHLNVMDTKTFNNCGDPDHMYKDCKEKKHFYPRPRSLKGIPSNSFSNSFWSNRSLNGLIRTLIIINVLQPPTQMPLRYHHHQITSTRLYTILTLILNIVTLPVLPRLPPNK